MIFLFIPSITEACALCVHSYVYYAFPFLYPGLISLTIWFLLYNVWKVRFLKDEQKKVWKNIWIHAFCILGFFFIGLLGGIFLFFLGFFLVAPFFYVDISQMINKEKKYIFWILWILTIIVLIIFIISSYTKYMQLSKLERIVYYVYSGTVVSKRMNEEYAKSSKFELSPLISLLRSNSNHKHMIAIEILSFRNDPTDFYLLRDEILNLPEKDIEDVYFQKWLKNLGSQKKLAKEELRLWRPKYDPDFSGF